MGAYTRSDVDNCGTRPSIFANSRFRTGFGAVPFTGPRSSGLSQLLQQTDMKETDVESVTHKTSVANLDVLPSGPNPPNPTELLTSEKFGKILSLAAEVV